MNCLYTRSLVWLRFLGKTSTVSLLALAFAHSQSLLLSAPASPEESNVQGESPARPAVPDAASQEGEYRIGAEDVLEISIFEAPDLNRTVRVSRGGEITFPPLGVLKVGGLSSRQVELTLEGLLRRTYVKSPHVVVFIKEIQSHPVFCFGFVAKPGMFQVRGMKSLIEVLSLAGGVLQGAGDSVLVVRGAGLGTGADLRAQTRSSGGAETGGGAADSEGSGAAAQARFTEPQAQIIRVSLRDLLESGNPAADVAIYAGDVITVPPPMLVYVVGEVSKPGGVPYKNDESLWQIMALVGGPTPIAKKNKARIIRVDTKTGERAEIPVDLNKILLAKSPGPALQPNDILYVPTSGGKRSVDRALAVALTTGPGLFIALSPRF